MAGQAVTVIDRLKAKAGKEAQVRQELFSLLGPTRAEEGCINFDMHDAPNDPACSCFTRIGRAKITSNGILRRRTSHAGSNSLKRCWPSRST